MNPFEFVCSCLDEERIELCGVVPLSECKIKYAHKLNNCGFSSAMELYAIIFAVPYLSKKAYESKQRNISLYACAQDYHIYFNDLFNKILPKLKNRYPGYAFCGFSDSSPIVEIEAAVKAGLGVIGDNHLLITEKYSSFVFLGEIITNYPVKDTKIYPVKHCKRCKSCSIICPVKDDTSCLSDITQRKGSLSKEETDYILAGDSVWGCDMCQLDCPHTKEAIKNKTIFTQIPYFNSNLTCFLSSELILNMSEQEFSRRAYSWRGKKVLLRNLDIKEANIRKEVDNQC